VAVPLTAAAAGRIDRCRTVVQASAEQGEAASGVVRALLVSFAVAVLAVYLALGLIDVFPLPASADARRCTWPLPRWRCFLLRVGLHLLRCCTKRTTRSIPTSRCCARTADTSYPIWRSAPRAVSRRGRRRVVAHGGRDSPDPVRSEQGPDGS
jgi:hypothetical protein